MANPTIHGPNFSTYVRSVRMALEEKGQAYDLNEVNIFAGENQSEAHLARHPWGKVPAFEHDGFQLYETSAILRYLDAAFAEPALQPTDARGQARMTQIQAIVDSYAYATLIGTLVINRLVKPNLGDSPDEQAIRDCLPEARKVMGEIDRLVGDDGFAVGGTLTLADLHLLPVLAYVAMTDEGAELFEQAPKLKRLYDTVSVRQSAKTTVPQL
jgi:glutathione S-transferase